MEKRITKVNQFDEGQSYHINSYCGDGIRFWRRLYLRGWRKDWKRLETDMESNQSKAKERLWEETEGRILGETNAKRGMSETRWKI